MNGDVAAQKFLDNIEYMDRALYRTIKEAVLRNVEGSQIAWCQYGSLLHSSELLKRDDQQMVTCHLLVTSQFDRGANYIFSRNILLNGVTPTPDF